MAERCDTVEIREIVEVDNPKPFDLTWLIEGLATILVDMGLKRIEEERRNGGLGDQPIGPRSSNLDRGGDRDG